jgi:hypothetical protein
MPKPALLSSALLEKTADLIVDGVHSLDRGPALDLLKQAARENSSLRRLYDHLSEHPEGLRSPCSDAPLVLARIARLLAEAGYDVGQPVCSDCGRAIPLPHSVPGGRLCRRCYKRGRTDMCCRCGRLRPVQARTADGAICGACHKRDTRETCAKCGKLSPVATRDPDRQPLCQTCRPNRRHGTCALCGQEHYLPRRTQVGWACSTCYARYAQPQRACGQCGRVRPIRIAAKDGNPDLCDKCYRSPTATCSVCGRERPCHGLKSGNPTCGSCRPRPRRSCAACGQVRRPSATRPPYDRQIARIPIGKSAT